EDIMAVLERIPMRSRNKVKEVTMDMAPNMAKAIRRCFRNAKRVVDRVHVQKLAYDAYRNSVSSIVGRCWIQKARR
ncbi:MAG: transposase, partial [Sphingobacterium hotanense]